MKRLIFLFMALSLVVGFALTMSVLPAAACDQSHQSCDNTPKTIHVKPVTLNEVQGCWQSCYITHWQFETNLIDNWQFITDRNDNEVQGCCHYITHWQFVITQIDNAGDVPASIHVTWSNGDSADVPLWKYTEGMAHYQTSLNPGAKVTDATATIYGCWSGQFNLSNVACGKPTPPVPEWPAIGLFGTGLVVIGMVIYRSRRSLSA